MKVQVGQILKIRPEDSEEIATVEVVEIISSLAFEVLELEGDCAGVYYSANIHNIVQE